MSLLVIIIVYVITILYSSTNKPHNFLHKILYNGELNNKKEETTNKVKAKPYSEIPLNNIEKEEIPDDFDASSIAEDFIKTVKKEVNE